TITVTGGENGTATGKTTASFTIKGPGGGGPQSVGLFSGNGSADSKCFPVAPLAGCSASSTPGSTTLPSFAASATVSAPGDLAFYEGAGAGLFTVLVDLNLLGLTPVCTNVDKGTGPLPIF